MLKLLEKVQALARNGLFYADNEYDRERYQALLDLAVDQYATALSGDADAIRQSLLSDARQVTPKVGADAAIFNDDGEILLMERVDGTGWCLPCGWVEGWESPADAAVREAFEETGLTVEVDRLVGVFTRRAGEYDAPVTMIAVVHLCHIVGGELTLSHEGTDLRYWAIDDVPRWHANHKDYAKVASLSWQTGDTTAVSN